MGSWRRLLALTIVFLMAFSCLGTAALAAGEGYAYTLQEETVIREDDTPLGAGPDEHGCCILHFLLGLGALGVTVYYTRERRKGQEREFELRSVLV